MALRRGFRRHVLARSLRNTKHCNELSITCCFSVIFIALYVVMIHLQSTEPDAVPSVVEDQVFTLPKLNLLQSKWSSRQGQLLTKEPLGARKSFNPADNSPRSGSRDIPDLKEPPPMRGAQINVAVRYLNHSQNIEHIHLNRAIMSLKANERHHLLHNECSSIFQGRPRINPRGYTDCVYGNEMQARRQRIKTVCEGHNGIRNRSELVTERFLIVKYRHLVWCPVYKAASTNWMVTLPSLTNFSPRDLDALSLKYRSQNELAQFVAKPRPKSSFEAYMALRPKPVTFLIVRHPFHRLLSAYRDKIEADNAYFLAKYGSGIVTKYRSEALERFGTTHDKHGTVLSPRPTFWEFIQAVLRDGLLDPHWHPISSWCGLCHLQFDFVIKFENLREEEDFLLGQLGLKNIVPISWENRNTQRAPWSLALQRHYFSALNSTEMKKLHELYRDDFELFEYDFKLSDYHLHTAVDKRGPQVQLPLAKKLGQAR